MGDNSNYQKRRLLVLGVGILAIAILTALVPLDQVPPLPAEKEDNTTADDSTNEAIN